MSEDVRRYHEESTHRFHAFAPGPGGLDWATQPDPFRGFVGCAVTRLPLAGEAPATRYAELRRAGATPAAPLDRDHLAVLLERALGLAAWKQLGSERWALRCNPSSGNLHPTEGYLLSRALPGLPGGVHHYRPRDHALEHRAAVDLDPALPADTALVGLSSIHWREAWKYGLRAYRYCQLDVGHALAALRYAAAALGWHLVLEDAWSDDAVAAALGLDRDADFTGAEPERPDLVARVGPAPGPVDAGAIATALAAAAWSGRASVLSPRRREWAGIADVTGATRAPPTLLAPWTPPALPPLRQPAQDPRAVDLFRQRRSGVDFDGRATLDREAFFTLLDALRPRPGVPPWDALPWMPRVHPVLFVHRVDGLDPGLYVLAREPAQTADLRRALTAAAGWDAVPGCPEHLPLFCLERGDLRRPARLLSCDQAIASDGVFAVAMIARFRASLDAGPWWYRRLFWEAGMLGQVLYLEAEAAGLRGTGIGCYFDDEAHLALGIEDDAWRDLYHFTVGRAVDDPRLTTLPPYGHLDGR